MFDGTQIDLFCIHHYTLVERANFIDLVPGGMNVIKITLHYMYVSDLLRSLLEY